LKSLRNKGNRELEGIQPAKGGDRQGNSLENGGGGGGWRRHFEELQGS